MVQGTSELESILVGLDKQKLQDSDDLFFVLHFQKQMNRLDTCSEISIFKH